MRCVATGDAAAGDDRPRASPGFGSTAVRASESESVDDLLRAARQRARSERGAVDGSDRPAASDAAVFRKPPNGALAQRTRELCDQSQARAAADAGDGPRSNRAGPVD